MALSERSRRALVVGAIAFVIGAGVAWAALALFGAGSRTGGALVAGAVVAIISVSAAAGRSR